MQRENIFFFLSDLFSSANFFLHGKAKDCHKEKTQGIGLTFSLFLKIEKEEAFPISFSSFTLGLVMYNVALNALNSLFREY